MLFIAPKPRASGGKEKVNQIEDGAAFAGGLFPALNRRQRKMLRVSIIPRPDRGVITLQLLNSAQQAQSGIDLSCDAFQSVLADFLAAWLVMDKGGGAPGDPGSWTNTPAIEGPAWNVGIRPLNEAITISLCPMKQGSQELWLSYAFPRSQAELLVKVLGQALARPQTQGSD